MHSEEVRPEAPKIAIVFMQRAEEVVVGVEWDTLLVVNAKAAVPVSVAARRVMVAEVLMLM